MFEWVMGHVKCLRVKVCPVRMVWLYVLMFYPKKKLNTRRENFIAMVKRAGKDISMGKITLGSHFATVSGSVVSAG